MKPVKFTANFKGYKMNINKIKAIIKPVIYCLYFFGLALVYLLGVGGASEMTILIGCFVTVDYCVNLAKVKELQEQLDKNEPYH